MNHRCLLASLLLVAAFVAPLSSAETIKIEEIAEVASDWSGQVVAGVDQSYAGWDVEIGDADNDGKNEILTTGCPDSRLYLFKQAADGWSARQLADRLARRFPGMGLAVKVVDLNCDGKNEVILGTGQEGPGTALFYVFQTDGVRLVKKLSSQPECNKSAYTHNLAAYDLNGDGVLEVISAYCGGGEIIRYDMDKELTRISARKIHNLSGSGEESLIADVDNDGKVEYITSNSFRAGKARVEIFDFNSRGELISGPRCVIDGVGGQGCFYASIMVGDVDNDGRNEMVVGWKQEQKVNRATVIGYRIVKTEAQPIYTFEKNTEDLDMAYFEKMMAIADADNDGRNELVISTRGDNISEFITSRHLGQVFLYRVGDSGRIKRDLLVKYRPDKAESSWLAVGDADNDGKNEVILATGKGDRTKPGTSYVLLIERR